MIQEVRTKSGAEAITSDQWHVIHARLTDSRGPRPFTRSIESEHSDRAACLVAAKALLVKLRATAKGKKAENTDEVFIRKPGFKSLKAGKARSAKD
jgi:hypothetical protein